LDSKELQLKLTKMQTLRHAQGHLDAEHKSAVEVIGGGWLWLLLFFPLSEEAPGEPQKMVDPGAHLLKVLLNP
jgi:hypothetical protein